MQVIIWIISVIVYVALIGITVTIARGKGRSALGFGIFAIFLPLIALIVAVIIGPLNRPGASSQG